MEIKKLTTSVLCVVALTSLLAIEDIPEIISKLQSYYSTYPQVRVHLSFTQDKYAPGDTAFFKAYFLTEDFKPIEQKQILTLQLKDISGAIVQMQNFKTEKGRGNNQIIFPEKMSPGNYKVLAFSDYMKNFSPSLYFQKEIMVVGRKEVELDKKKELMLSVHPDGGSMVTDVDNVIVIKSNKTGNGRIISQSGALVTEFQIGQSGVTSTTIKPTVGTSYYAVMEGSDLKIDLPEPTDEGCALQIVSENENIIDLQIAASPNASLLKQELFFVATALGKVVDSAPFKFEGDKPVILKVQNLSEGLNQFTIFDKKNNVVAERIYYLSPKPIYAAIDLSKNEIPTRGLVDFEVSLRDNIGRTVNGDFIVSAVNTSILPDKPSMSFYNEIVLFGDIPQLRNDFEKSGMEEAEWLKYTNTLLTCYKWERIPWGEVLKGKREGNVVPFKYSLSVSGKAQFKASGDPVPDSTLIMIYQQRRMIGYETYVGKQGEFTFPFIYDFEGDDQLFYMMEFKKREKQSDYWIDPEVDIKTEAAVIGTETDVADVYGEYKFRKKLIDKSFEFFRSPEKNGQAKSYNPNLEFEDELGGVDVTIKVDDYLVFPTMPDLIHEVISGLQQRVVNGKRTVRVVFIRNTYTVIPKGDPLYIIDGVFTANTEYFLSLNPEDVLTIKLVNAENKLNRFGGMGKYGVVIVQTKKSIRNEVIENSTIFSISGLSEEIKFKAPAYSDTNSSRVPDLRSTLFWDPNAAAFSDGRARFKFYASDDAVPVMIIVKGITHDGKPFSTQQIVNIKSPVIGN